MSDFTQCPRCFGRGYCCRYPRSGGIRTYNCPRCSGTGEIPTPGYVVQGPNARFHKPNKRAALRFARELARLGSSATVYAPQCAYRLASYTRGDDGRVRKAP